MDQLAVTNVHETMQQQQHHQQQQTMGVRSPNALDLRTSAGQETENNKQDNKVSSSLPTSLGWATLGPN